MNTIIRIQLAEQVDNITDGGAEMTKLPMPYFAEADGSIGKQEFWDGSPKRVVGFARDLSVHDIDLWWDDAFQNPQKALGMYLVTGDKHGQMHSHTTAVDSMEVLPGTQDQGDQGRTTGS